MKINLDKTILDPDNNPIQVSDTQVMTLGGIVCQALLGTFEGDRPDGAEKHKRYSIWREAARGGEIEMQIEDVVLVKKLVGLGWPPLICGQAWDLLEKS